MTTEDIKQIIDGCIRATVGKNNADLNIVLESDRVEINMYLHDKYYDNGIGERR